MSKSKVILFGGATGDTGKYIITGDTYALDLICNKWAKLDGKYHINDCYELSRDYKFELTLLVLNRIWNLPITQSCSWQLSGRLSADGSLRRSYWR